MKPVIFDRPSSFSNNHFAGQPGRARRAAAACALAAAGLAAGALSPAPAHAQEANLRNGHQVFLRSLTRSILGMPATATDVCLSKTAGTLDLTVPLSALGLSDSRTILLTGMVLPGSSNVVRWTFDQTYASPPIFVPVTGTPLTAHVSRIRGQLTAALTFEETHGASCGTGSYSISARATGGSDRVRGSWAEGFYCIDGVCSPPDFQPAVQPIQIDGFFAQAGDGPPPPPPPVVSRISADHAAVCQSGSAQTVEARVILDRPAQGPFHVTLWGDTPLTIVESGGVDVPTGATGATFHVQVLAGWSGARDVWAQGPGAPARSLTVESIDPLFCHELDAVRYSIEESTSGQCPECVLSVLDPHGVAYGEQHSKPIRWAGGPGPEVLSSFFGDDTTFGAISASGGLAGSSGGKAFLWRRSEQTAESLVLFDGASVLGLNDGAAVGYGLSSNGRPAAVLLADGASTALGTLGGGASVAVAINAQNQIAGHATLQNGLYHAFRFVGGAMTDLGDLGGGVTLAAGISADGTVIGSGLTADGSWNGFLAPPAGGLIPVDGLADMPRTILRAINEHGVAVGRAEGNGGKTRAIRFTTSAGTVDLNDGIDPDTGFVALEALAINESGRILVRGEAKGTPAYFVMAPLVGEAAKDPDGDKGPSK